MTPTEAVVQVMQEHPSRDILDIHIMRCEIDGKVAALVPIEETVQIVRDMLNAGQVRGKMRQGKILYSLVERTVEPGWRPEVVSELEDDEPEKLYLVCINCGEAFDEIRAAQEHGSTDPNTKSWCGEEGFNILPESEAM